MPDCYARGKRESVFVVPLRQSELPQLGQGRVEDERPYAGVKVSGEHVVNGEVMCDARWGQRAGCVDVAGGDIRWTTQGKVDPGKANNVRIVRKTVGTAGAGSGDRRFAEIRASLLNKKIFKGPKRYHGIQQYFSNGQT